MKSENASTIAVVGASSNRSKFGNKCVRAYSAAGWTVLPVNPKADSIEGLQAYSSLADIPQPLDRISIYLPPAETLRILPTLPLGVETFFNPGSATAEVLSAASRRRIDVRDACSIVDIGLSPASFPG